MKKLIALLLAVMTVLSLFAACGGDTATETQPEATKKDFSEFEGIVADPKTWYETFMALPIANADMTEEELRQLAVDEIGRAHV